MRIPLFLLIIALALINDLFSQNLEWHNTFHKGAISNPKDHLEYSDNALYVAGNYNYSVDLDTVTLGPNSFTGNFYISKYDTLGNLIWSLKGGADGKEDYLSDMKVDEFGNVYLLGEFTDSLRIDSLLLLPNCPPSLLGPKKRDGFLIKLLPSGVVDWSKVFYGPNCNNIGTSKPRYMSVVDSSIFLTGEFNNSIRVSNSNLSLNKNHFSRDYFVMKFDLAGNHLFLKRVVENNSGGVNTGILDIKATSDSTFYIAAFLSGDYEFGSNKINYLSSGLDPVVISFTMDSASWHITPKGFGNANAGINNIMFDANTDSHIFLAGSFSYNVIIDNDTLFSTQNLGFSTSWYIVKLNKQGLMIANKVIPIDGYELIDFSISKNSEVNVLGSFTDSVIYLDSVKVLNKSSRDMLIYALDSGLNYNWHLNESGFIPDDVVFDNNNSSYVLSEYKKSQNFGLETIDSLNFGNYLLVKLNDCKQYLPYDIGKDVTLDNTNSSVTFDAGGNHATYKWSNNASGQYNTVYYDPLKAGLTDTIVVNTTTAGNCKLSDTAYVFYDLSTSLNAFNQQSGFKLYPNPFNNDINISTDDKISEIEVMDANGRVIIRIANPSNVLKLNSLNTGLYFLRIRTNDSVVVSQIVKR